MKTKPAVVFLMLAGLLTPGAHAQAVRAYSWSLEGGGYLGVTLRDVTTEDVSRLGLSQAAGVIIESVVPDTPADAADLLESDLVLSFAGQDVLSVRQLQRLVSETPVGRSVSVTVLRSGRTLTKTVTIGKRDFRFEGPEAFHEFRHPEGFDDFDVEIPELSIEPGKNVFIYRNRPRLGIQGQTLTGQMADFLGVTEARGVLVMEVLENTPAATAGLQAGDVIVAVDGNKVDSISSLSSRLKTGTHQLTIVRDGNHRELSLEMEQKQKIREKDGNTIKM
jgi:serine protease Do